MRIVFILILALSLFIHHVHAQKKIYNFLHFTEKDGLASNEIAGLAEDRNGLIWITSKRGLSFFDGQKFTDVKFEGESEVLTNYLGSIAIDPQDRIWITTQNNGLICYDRTKPNGKNLKSYHAKISQSGLVKNSLYDVIVSKSGIIYFSGQETDLQALNPTTGEIKQVVMPRIKSDNYLTIFSLKEDSLGNIWLGTRYDGIIRYNPKNNSAQQINLANTGENAVDGFIFRPDRFYAGYYDHDLISAKYDFSDLKTSLLGWEKNKDYYDNFISCNTFWPSENKILIGHVLNGLYAYKPELKTLEHISWDDLMPELPKPSRIHAICAVANGYWVATSSGLFFYSQKLNQVNTLIADNSEDPIIELFKWKNKTWYWTKKNFGEMETSLTKRKSSFSLQGLNIGSINTTPSAIYFSTIDKGVYEFRNPLNGLKPLEIKGNEFNFRNADCNSVILDTLNAEEILWIGSWNSGLYKYRISTKTIELFSVNDGLPDHKIITLGKDGNGDIWLGMDGYGIVLLEEKETAKFKQFAQQQSSANTVQSNTVFTFYLDNEKRFWFSNSNSGIGEIKPNGKSYQFIQYTDQNIYPWLYPIQITADKNGLFWIQALDGTMLFDRKSKVFIHLNKSEGIYPPANIKTYNFYLTDNEVIWCTEKGLIKGQLPMFHSDKSPEINVLINKFFVHHQDRSFELFNNEIKLGADDNNFSFHFAVVEQLTKQGLDFEYQLVGFDNSWVKSSSEQLALYNNLDGGKYEFKVRVRDQFGNWSPKISSVRIDLASHWYSTIWFKILLVMLFIAAITMFFLYRIREHKNINKLQLDYNDKLKEELSRNAIKIKEQAADIEREKQERMENNYKQKLYESELKAIRSQMNPHFIFNVLNSIEAYVVERDSKSASRLIQKFASISRLVLENSQFSTVGLKSEIQLLKLYLELEQERFNHAFDFQMDIQKGLVDEHIKIPSMLIQPMVENAVHHGVRHLKDKKGFILLKISEDENKIVIEILDNGVGFKDSPSIKSSSFKTSSFGIKGVRERINIINSNLKEPIASLQIEQLIGEEFTTKVVINLPAHHKISYPE